MKRMKINTNNIIEIFIDLAIGILSCIFLDVTAGIFLGVSLTSIAVNRLFFQSSIENYREEMSELKNSFIELSSTTAILDKSAKITQHDLLEYKNKILKNAVDELNAILVDKRSKYLETDIYYDMLFTFLKDAIDNPKGRKIWAISLMLSIEWDDSEWEKQFLELNIEAAKNGVYVERIFIVEKDKIAELLTIPAIKAQYELSKNQSNMVLRIAKIEELQRARGLLDEISYGFIAFDNKKIMIDVLDQKSNLMRGYLDVNDMVVEEKEKIFNRLKSASAPFNSLIGRDNPSKSLIQEANHST